ncbi:MAG: adenylate/guanylate cyclase domain-containing protein [Chloroflexota bacterium]
MYIIRARRQLLLSCGLILAGIALIFVPDFGVGLSVFVSVIGFGLLFFALTQTLSSRAVIKAEGIKIKTPLKSFFLHWNQLGSIEPIPISQLFPQEEISPAKRASLGRMYHTTGIVMHLKVPFPNWYKWLLPWPMLPPNGQSLCLCIKDWSKFLNECQAVKKRDRSDQKNKAEPTESNTIQKKSGQLDLLIVSAGSRQVGNLVNVLKNHYVIEVAKSGVDAIQVIRLNPALVLVDENLPDNLSPAATIQTLQKYQKQLKSGFLVLFQEELDDDVQFGFLEIGVKAFLNLDRSLHLAVRQISFWLDWQNQVKRMAKRNQELYGQNLFQRSELARHGELKNFLPKNVAQEIIAGAYTAETHRLRKQTVTVLFADIVGFTPLSAQLTPEVLAELLNDYLQEMTQVVVSHEGIVDKFIGDEVMAIFGAPEVQAETIQVHNAFSAALSMIEVVKGLDQKWNRHLPAKLDIRVGINTGPCTTGVFGSSSLQSYTVIGSPVNLAARLTSAAPQGGILTCENSLKWVKERAYYQSVGGITLKGISHPVGAFQIVSLITPDEVF